MKKGILIVAFLFCATVIPANEPETGVASYPQFMEVMEKSLPELTTQEFQTRLAQNNILLSKAAFDTRLNASWEYYRTKEYNLSASYFLKDSTTGDNLTGGISTVVQPSGTRLSSQLLFQRATVDGEIISPPRETTYKGYYSGIQLKVSQPLLYNAFGMLDRYSLNDAKSKYEIAGIQQEESRRSVLVFYKKLFFTLHYYKIASEVVGESEKNSQTLYNQVLRKNRVGLAESDDIASAQSNLLKYQIQQAELGRDQTTLLSETTPYTAIDIPALDRTEFSSWVEKSLATEFAKVEFRETRQYRILEKTLDNEQTKAQTLKNALLPSLDVYGSVTRKNFSDIQSDVLTSIPDTDYAVGFEVSYSFDNRQAKANARAADIAVKQLRSELETAQNNYNKSLDSILKGVERDRQIYQQKKILLQTLQRELAAEQRKYNQARLDLRYLIDTRNRIASAQLDITSLELQMVHSLIDYNYLTGREDEND